MSRLPTYLLLALMFLAACQPAQTAAPPTFTPIPTSTPVPPTDTPIPPTPTSIPPTATPTEIPATPTPLPPMALSSDAFEAEGEIPVRFAQKPFTVSLGGNASFACFGSPAGKENLSPPLSWVNVPPEAKSLALVMVDDLHYAYPKFAKEGDFFSHWVMYNIPPSATGLPEGISAELTLPDGTLQGLNNYPKPYQQGYGGPCPPEGEKHLYIFRLYAVDRMLDLPAGAKYAAVIAALEGHVLAQAELRAYYTGK